MLNYLSHARTAKFGALHLISFLWRHPGHLFWIWVAYLPWLGRMSVPLTGDQKVYISIALEMFREGNWLQPLLFGEPSYFKPPFQYWATLLSWKVFGLNLWATLFPSVLCVVLIAWLLGEISSLIGERRWFVNSGLWFAATLGTMTYGTTAQMEIYLCLFYAGAWWAALKFLSVPPAVREWKYLYLALAIAGLSSLVKSPLYSVLWVVSFFSYLFFSGEWLLFRDRRYYLAHILGVALGLAWYVVIFFVDGDRFWSDYLMRETWEKKAGNHGTMISLWLALAYFCLPFTLLIFPSIRGLLRGERTRAVLRFVICWSWPPALFFTFYPYRIKPYLYILVPALAVLIDWGYFRVGRTRTFRALLISTATLVGVVSLGLALFAFRTEMINSWIVWALTANALISIVCGLKKWMRGSVLCSLALISLIRMSAVSLGEVDINGLRNAVASEPNAPIVMLDEKRDIWHELGLLSVAIEKPIARATTVEESLEALSEGALLVLSEDQLPKYGELLQSKNVEVMDWPRLKGRKKFPYKEFILNGRGSIDQFESMIFRSYKILKLTDQ